MLNRSSRALLAAAAFASFAASFVATPFTARSAAGIPRATVQPHPTAARTAAMANVSPLRDPFAGEPASTVAHDRAPAADPIALAAPRIPAVLGPLPPNAGAPPAPFAPAAESVRVRAVITGDPPYALVDDTGTSRIAGIRDRFAGDTIVAISATGVRLAGGRTIGVEPPAPSAALTLGDRRP